MRNRTVGRPPSPRRPRATAAGFLRFGRTAASGPRPTLVTGSGPGFPTLNLVQNL